MRAKSTLAQSAGVVEYNGCISAEEGPSSSKEYSRYDIKHSDGEAPAWEIGEMWSTLYSHYSHVQSDLEW